MTSGSMKGDLKRALKNGRGKRACSRPDSRRVLREVINCPPSSRVPLVPTPQNVMSTIIDYTANRRPNSD